MGKLVSVLIPVFNHEKFIVQCLDSIISDDYPDKEIIILDDGSTDNSFFVIKTWLYDNQELIRGKINVKLISRENRGICKSLNELITMANGEYVCLIASDDYLLAGGIKIRVDYLETHLDKMAVFADCIVVDDSNTVIFKSGIEDFYHGRKKFLLMENMMGDEIVFRWSVPGPVFLARSDVYKTIGYYKENLIAEDRDFYLRLISRNLLGFIDASVAAYRIHNSNTISNRKVAPMLRKSMQISALEGMKLLQGMKKVYLFSNFINLKGIECQEGKNKLLGLFYRIVSCVIRIPIILLYNLRAQYAYLLRKW